MSLQTYTLTDWDGLEDGAVVINTVTGIPLPATFDSPEQADRIVEEHGRVLRAANNDEIVAVILADRKEHGG